MDFFFRNLVEREEEPLTDRELNRLLLLLLKSSNSSNESLSQEASEELRRIGFGRGRRRGGSRGKTEGQTVSNMQFQGQWN